MPPVRSAGGIFMPAPDPPDSSTTSSSRAASPAARVVPLASARRLARWAALAQASEQ
ncbi:MAG TPA: hypothetical protein VGS19_01155 [Streptosporangiaceae bacterium]|nr:hypothetical protein [Streptosporangiaceae bacterium]